MEVNQLLEDLYKLYNEYAACRSVRMLDEREFVDTHSLLESRVREAGSREELIDKVREIVLYWINQGRKL